VRPALPGATNQTRPTSTLDKTRPSFLYLSSSFTTRSHLCCCIAIDLNRTGAVIDDLRRLLIPTIASTDSRSSPTTATQRKFHLSCVESAIPIPAALPHIHWVSGISLQLDPSHVHRHNSLHNLLRVPPGAHWRILKDLSYYRLLQNPSTGS
jgi:hypothetical protein